VSSPLYFAPSAVEEAVELLASHEGGRPVAGGTDVVVAARNGKQPLPGVLVALHKLSELRHLRVQDSQLQIGALVTHQEIAESSEVITDWPALADASLLVGSPATRGTGTVGGNVMNASPAMELGAPLLVHGASVRLVSSNGERLVEVDQLWLGPGRTSAAAGELMTEVILPRAAPGSGSAYLRLEYRQAMEIAVVGAACLVTVDSGRVVGGALALTAVAPTCTLVEGVADLLSGLSLDSLPVARVAELAVEQAAPISDVRASSDYRSVQIGVIATRALRVAVRRAQGETIEVPANRSVSFVA
jgi:CO/xanthine dehydrogenase FAD-binding subunit